MVKNKKSTVFNLLKTVNLYQSIFVTYAPVRLPVRCLSQGKTFAFFFLLFDFSDCSDLLVRVSGFV